jgi:hypothetical protein
VCTLLRSISCHRIVYCPFINRFLLTAPSTSADEQLLTDIIRFLGAIVMQSKPDNSASVFNWIADALLNTKGAVYQLLNKLTVLAEKDLTDSAQTVHRCLFFISFVNK